jgi:hypothetical protein
MSTGKQLSSAIASVVLSEMDLVIINSYKNEVPSRDMYHMFTEEKIFWETSTKHENVTINLTPETSVDVYS